MQCEHESSTTIANILVSCEEHFDAILCTIQFKFALVCLRKCSLLLAFSRRLLRFFLKSLRCHLGSHRSGSGLGPGFSGSKFLGRRGFCFLFFFSRTAPVDRSASEGRFLTAPLLTLLPAGKNRHRFQEHTLTPLSLLPIQLLLHTGNLEATKYLHCPSPSALSVRNSTTSTPCTLTHHPPPPTFLPVGKQQWHQELHDIIPLCCDIHKCHSI